MGANLYSTSSSNLAPLSYILEQFLNAVLNSFQIIEGAVRSTSYLMYVTFSQVELLFILRLTLTLCFLNLQNCLVSDFFKTPSTPFFGIFCVVSLACEICKIETSAVCIFCKSPLFVRKYILYLYIFTLNFCFVLPLKVYKEIPLYHMYRSQINFFKYKVSIYLFFSADICH